MNTAERVLQEAMESEAGREEREAAEAKLAHEHRLIIAVKNAEAIAQTLCHLGERIDELGVMLNRHQDQINAVKGEVGQQRGLIVTSLQQKYGTGPTAGG